MTRPASPPRRRLRLLQDLAARAADDELEMAARILGQAVMLLSADHRGTLFRLIYISQNETATPAGSRAILGIAQPRNAAVGITGALIHSESWFGQVLEGGLMAVETTFARIRRDTRHRDIRVLRMEPVKSREFGQWAMAEAGLAPERLLVHAALMHQRLGGCTAPGLHSAARDIMDLLHSRVDG